MKDHIPVQFFGKTIFSEHLEKENTIFRAVLVTASSHLINSSIEKNQSSMFYNTFLVGSSVTDRYFLGSGYGRYAVSDMHHHSNFNLFTSLRIESMILKL